MMGVMFSYTVNAVTLGAMMLVLAGGCGFTDNMVYSVNTKKDYREIKKYNQQKITEWNESNKQEQDSKDLSEIMRQYLYTKHVENFGIWKEAAEKGVPEGQILLGWCCFCGVGVKQDMAVGVSWIHKAAEKGHPDAQVDLAGYYLTGNGVPESREEAVKWYKKAAQQGNKDARRMILELLGESESLEKLDTSKSKLVGKWQAQNGSAPRGFPDNLELFKDGTGICDKANISWDVKEKRFVISSALQASAFNYGMQGNTLFLIDDDGKRVAYEKK